MSKPKVFEAVSSYDLQNQLYSWLENNQGIEIKHTEQSIDTRENGMTIIYTILYKV